jgi:tripartite-type tricarboxylate transporter receptor subunit TctC
MPNACAPRSRRCAVLCLLGLALTPFASSAQEWPSKAVTLVVPFPPGGSNDVAARVVAESARKRLGQTVVVDNKPGANGALGVDAVLRAPKDHHTFLVASDSVSLLPLFRTSTWDLSKSFTPIAVLSYQPIVVVTAPSSGLKTIKDLQARARSKPNEVAYASSGQGSLQHLVGELFSQNLGIDLLHIPYQGGGQAVTPQVRQAGRAGREHAQPLAHVARHTHPGRERRRRHRRAAVVCLVRHRRHTTRRGDAPAAQRRREPGRAGGQATLSERSDGNCCDPTRGVSAEDASRP